LVSAHAATATLTSRTSVSAPPGALEQRDPRRERHRGVRTCQPPTRKSGTHHVHRGCTDEGQAAMLTIGKLGASPDQLAYYEQRVAQGLEDYFSGRGEAPGRWIGGGGFGRSTDGRRLLRST
jgi:hypothetical protein